jgi:hypothetical protein
VHWITYQPTAFFLDAQNIYTNLGIQNLEFARFQADTLRYTLGYPIFELSLNFISQAEERSHGHLRLKTLFYKQAEVEPSFQLAGGLRSRVYREKKEEQTEEERAREDLSFFLVASGYVNPFNILYNFYIDNYTTGIGTKLFLPHELTLFLDTRLDYQSERRDSYATLGIEHFPSPNIGYSLSFSGTNVEPKEESSENMDDDRDEDEEENRSTSSANLGIHFIF